MVYIAGQNTKLAIVDAPQMKVEEDQYVFWAADGASLTIGGKNATESATVSGKVAATGTAMQMPTVTLQGSANISGAVEANTANISLDDNAKLTGAIEVSNSQVVVDGNSKIDASLTAAAGSDVTINSKENVITTLDKTLDSFVTITESITVEEVAQTSEDKTIIVAGDGDNIQVVDETGAKQTDVVQDRSAQEDAVAVIGKTFYEDLDLAVSKAKSKETIKLLKTVDFGSSCLLISSDKNIVFDLNGYTLKSSADVIINSGVLTIVDNSEDKKGLIKSTGDCGVVTIGSTAKTTIESGNVETQEVALMLFDGAGAVVNGGTFTTVDNFVVGTNGSKGRGNNNIVINGGTFNGNITSSGYVACGIYAPNDDSITVNGGTFIITGGAGIVARAGNVTVTGGTFTCSGNTTGKVGDSRVVVPCSAIVFDSAASYPGLDDDSCINVSGGTFISEDEKGVVYFVRDENDNNERIVLTGGEYSTDPSEFVPAGYAAVQEGINKYVVKKIADEYGYLFAGGKGTVEEPFLIYDYDTMQNISKLYDVGYCCYEVAIDRTDNGKIDCRSDWVSVYLNGSFDGKGVEFINVDKKLFRSVGRIADGKSTRALYLKDFDVTFSVHTGQGASLIHNLFCLNTDFTDVNIHGYLEGGANSAAYYNYGCLNNEPSLNAKMTVNFHDCDVDATMVSVSGNLGLFSGMCYGGTGVNKTTINADSDCDWTGSAYLKSGSKLYKLCGVNANAYLANTSENVEITDSVSASLIVKTPAKDKDQYVVEALESTDYVIVYVNGQFTEHDSTGAQIPHANGITVTLGSFVLDWDEVEDNVIFDAITSVVFNPDSDLSYEFSEGVLTFSAGGRDDNTSGSISIRACQYNSDDQLIAASGELIVVEKSTYNGTWIVK